MRSPRNRIIPRSQPDAEKRSGRRIDPVISGIAVSLAAAAALALVLAGGLGGCGRAPSSLLRQGQLPLFDFPLYVIESGAGRIQKIGRGGDDDKEVLISGLNGARSIATDRYNRLFVSEANEDRILEVDVDSGDSDVFIDGIDTPGAIAVDPFGEVFVVEEGTNRVLRARDREVFAVYATLPTGIAFGVNGILIVTLESVGRVDWIANPRPLSDGATNTEFEEDADIETVTGLNTPTNVAVDSMGRVYVAENVAGIGRLLRFHQREPGDESEIAAALNFPAGMAVDPIGNTYVAEAGASAVNIVTFNGTLYQGWATGLLGPEGLAFTQY
ncbi:MAG: hypothetical protein IT285_14270 [Bdellovibrionales bacterium]|nr:hypothetical protein [Bdellovibrionales bacterium]